MSTTCASPARAAARTVNSRATSSNEAGSVSTTSCWARRIAGKAGVPGLAEVCQVTPADLHRRKLLHVRRPVPGQDRRRAIHARVAQPRLGRHGQPSGHQRAVIAGKETHRMILGVLAPREAQRLRRELLRRRLVMERGERLAGLDQARGDQLRDVENLHLPRFFAGIDIAHGRVGRAQVDADHVAARSALERRTQAHPPLTAQGKNYSKLAIGKLFTADHGPQA